MKPEHVQRLYTALKMITCYQTPDQLRRSAEKQYGLPAEKVIELAYENVLEAARQAIKGIRAPLKAHREPSSSESTSVISRQIKGIKS